MPTLTLGEKAWSYYALREKVLENIRELVSQAVLFHVAHESVDPLANEVTICLCNGDRLDRVRLGEWPEPKLMYHDGVWKDLAVLSQKLLGEVTLGKVRADMGGWAGG